MTSSMKQYDISEISKMLAARVESVCQWLLPQGKREGSEWRCGDVDGGAGHSLGVNLAGKPGVWRDFADEAKGGDLIDLIRSVKGISTRDAVSEAKEFLGVVENAPSFARAAKKYVTPSHPSGLTMPSPEMLLWFENRGISQKTVSDFMIGEVIHSQKGPSIVFPYMRDKKLVFIKFRPLHDKKGMWTSKDSEPCLFGWDQMPENSRAIVICEGELDAMAFHEAGVAALSVPRGGGEGDKQDGWIDAEWERLKLFDSIYLALDKDEQGFKASEHISRRLGQHRCFVVDFGGYKDANEALLAGVDLKTIFDTAHTVDPEELRNATEYLDEVFDYFENEAEVTGNPLPWEKTQGRIGLRTGETSIWAGINGHGKSQILGHVMVDSASRGGTWCVASMEFRPYKMLARMARQACAKNKPLRDLDKDSLDSLWRRNLWVFDVQGTAKHDRILEVFEYAYRRYGVTNFVIDSLAKCGLGDDDYNQQKKFIDKLSDFARNNEVQMHLVCHSRKKNDENDVPDKFDIKGTGSLTDMVDNVFIVWRNKPKEQKIADANSDFSRQQAMASGPDAILNCCKQRNGEWEGIVKLWYDKASLQYLDSATSFPKKYC